MKFFKEKRADIFSVETVLSLFVIFFGFAFLLVILPAFHHQQKLDSFTRELVRSCEIEGTVNQTSYVNTLKQKLSIDPQIKYIYQGFRSSKRVQLNGEIRVECRDTYRIGNKFITIKIPMVSVATGKSEVYYKK